MRPALLVLALAAPLACGGTAGPPAGAGPDGGAGAAPGGSGSGGSSGGGTSGAAAVEPVTFERLDDGGDCAGLVPDRAPPPVPIQRPHAAGEACLGGTSDGTGAVALGARAPSGAITWQVYGPGGAARGAFAAEAPILPQPSGWQAIQSTGPQGSSQPEVWLASFAPDGAASRRERVSPDPSAWAYPRWDLAQDPQGGSVVVLRASSLAGNHWTTVLARRFDAAGAPRWPAPPPVRTVSSAVEPLFLAAGVSVRGEAFALSQHSAFLDASWLDASSGAPLAGASADQAEPYAAVSGDSLQPDLHLLALLDGALAARAGGTFRRAYARLATVSTPLPAWLAERAACTFRFTRGGAGYAVLPAPGQPSPDCTQRIDLVSPSGRLCGRAVLREGGSACVTGAVDQGWDGTVVQQSGQDPCAYRAWPRLLAR